MLRPIPSDMLKDSAVFHVPTGLDRYQKPVYADYKVSNVHIQNANEIRRSTTNTEVVLSAILFVDMQKSFPKLDYMKLQKQAQAVGQEMTVTVTDAEGNSFDYTVMVVDAVPNVPANTVHHTEIGLV